MLRFGIYLYMCLFISEIRSTINNFKLKQYHNRKSSANMISVDNHVSKIMCAKVCMADSRCASVNYKEGTCEKHFPVGNNALMLSEDSGWRYIGKRYFFCVVSPHCKTFFI